MGPWPNWFHQICFVLSTAPDSWQVVLQIHFDCPKVHNSAIHLELVWVRLLGTRLAIHVLPSHLDEACLHMVVALFSYSSKTLASNHR